MSGWERCGDIHDDRRGFCHWQWGVGEVGIGWGILLISLWLRKKPRPEAEPTWNPQGQPLLSCLYPLHPTSRRFSSFPDSTTIGSPRVQTHEPVRDTSHSQPNSRHPVQLWDAPDNNSKLGQRDSVTWPLVPETSGMPVPAPVKLVLAHLGLVRCVPLYFCEIHSVASILDFGSNSGHSHCPSVIWKTIKNNPLPKYFLHLQGTGGGRRCKRPEQYLLPLNLSA